MTQEEKQLLLKDLCGRLPYGVIIKSISGDDYGPAIDICYPQGVVAYMGQKIDAYTEEFLPYLRPMSSMTDEETDTYDRMVMCNASWVVDDWLLSHHFDYRGLIDKGLALEAPEDMYKQ